MGASNRGKSIHPNLRAAVKKNHSEGKGTQAYSEWQAAASAAAWAKPGHRAKKAKAT